MQKVWTSKNYYIKARKGSMDLEHPGMKLLLKLAESSNKILDLGCGEGTRLSIIGKNNKDIYGIDISSIALINAKRVCPGGKFIKSSLSKLPFDDNEFDLVYSAYTFEHIDNPKLALKEAVRVAKNNLVIICPNYGSPNRSSPNFRKSRTIKLLKGFFQDFIKEDISKWQKVDPFKVNAGNYKSDDDTTIEPYIHSLIHTLEYLGMKIVSWNVCWNYELPSAKVHQKIFRRLASFGIPPFIYWGPHIVVHAEKL